MGLVVSVLWGVYFKVCFIDIGIMFYFCYGEVDELVWLLLWLCVIGLIKDIMF